MLSHFHFLRRIKLEKNVGLIGLDIGTTFIGVGLVHDAFGSGTPKPFTTLNRRECNIVESLQKLTPGMHGIVVGMPSEMSTGTDFVTNTINILSKEISLPFVLVNEDNSTVAATDFLYNINPRYAHRKLLQDQIAACIILKRFIKDGRQIMHTLPS